MRCVDHLPRVIHLLAWSDIEACERYWGEKKAAEAGKYLPEKNKIKNNEKSVLLTMVGGLQQSSC